MFKRYFRFLFFGLSLLFIGKIIWQNSSATTSFTLGTFSLFLLFSALIITIVAHTWAAYIWYIILRQFQLKNLNLREILSLYLQSNIYKYVPGNIGHFYLRISTLHQAGYSLSLVSLSVLLEPILMALAAVWLGLVCFTIETTFKPKIILGCILGSIFLLFLLHPRVLNQLLKFKKTKIEKYPLLPLLGEFIFILLRGSGFILTAAAFGLSNFTELMGAFSLAWVCGLVIPGVPGGLGVFEATLLALLNNQHTATATLLKVVALFRIISLAAEIMAAVIAKASSFWFNRNQ